MTGIDAVDASWGGLYQGGTYLCYGDAASGRGLLAMMFLQAGVEQGESCLFISPGRPQDWFIQADSVSFDLQGAYEQGLVRLLWIPDVSGLHHLDDQMAARALSDFVTIVAQERPMRVVINDFMPFMQFRSFDGFRQAFLGALEALSATETTILLLLPDPINPVSQKIIDFVRNYVSGSIHLELDASSSAGATRRMTLLPGIGHVLHEQIEHWDIASEGGAPRPSARGPLRVRTAAGKKAHSFSPVEQAAGARAATPAFAAQPAGGIVDRAEFVDALRLCYKRRGQDKGSFTLMALRIDANNPTPSPVPFPELADHVERVLRADDRLLVDPTSRRLVVLMPEARPDLVQRFFDALQKSLAREYPSSQQHLLESVSVVVVPDGQPFERAEDFMAYAMEAR
ncbi:MAG: ATPase domain-containing protein [Rhodothermales bacterium]|nr:ATPase domain-containing protein [Rhodothermales bacterium]